MIGYRHRPSSIHCHPVRRIFLDLKSEINMWDWWAMTNFPWILHCYSLSGALQKFIPVPDRLEKEDKMFQRSGSGNSVWKGFVFTCIKTNYKHERNWNKQLYQIEKHNIWNNSNVIFSESPRTRWKFQGIRYEVFAVKMVTNTIFLTQFTSVLMLKYRILAHLLR